MIQLKSYLPKLRMLSSYASSVPLRQLTSRQGTKTVELGMCYFSPETIELCCLLIIFACVNVSLIHTPR